MNDDDIWKRKVLAYIHDPVEKALALLRGETRQAATVTALLDRLGGDAAWQG